VEQSKKKLYDYTIKYKDFYKFYHPPSQDADNVDSASPRRPDSSAFLSENTKPNNSFLESVTLSDSGNGAVFRGHDPLHVEDVRYVTPSDYIQNLIQQTRQTLTDREILQGFANRNLHQHHQLVEAIIKRRELASNKSFGNNNMIRVENFNENMLPEAITTPTLSKVVHSQDIGFLLEECISEKKFNELYQTKLLISAGTSGNKLEGYDDGFMVEINDYENGGTLKYVRPSFQIQRIINQTKHTMTNEEVLHAFANRDLDQHHALVEAFNQKDHVGLTELQKQAVQSLGVSKAMRRIRRLSTKEDHKKNSATHNYENSQQEHSDQTVVHSNKKRQKSLYEDEEKNDPQYLDPLSSNGVINSGRKDHIVFTKQHRVSFLSDFQSIQDILSLNLETTHMSINNGLSVSKNQDPTMITDHDIMRELLDGRVIVTLESIQDMRKHIPEEKRRYWASELIHESHSSQVRGIDVIYMGINNFTSFKERWSPEALADEKFMEQFCDFSRSHHENYKHYRAVMNGVPYVPTTYFEYMKETVEEIQAAANDYLSISKTVCNTLNHFNLCKKFITREQNVIFERDRSRTEIELL
jgi:hypothetical protein